MCAVWRSTLSLHMTAKGTKRLTSWQRRRAKRAQSSGSTDHQVMPQKTNTEAMLNEACRKTKAASEAARQRFRAHVAAEPGDDALIQAYSAAKAAMNDFKAARQSSGCPDTQQEGAREDAQEQFIHGSAAGEVASKRDRASTREAPNADALEVPVKRRRSSAREDARTTVAEIEGVTPWYCEVCRVTISVRADGRAREQHLAGAKHLARLADVAASVPQV